MAIPSKTYMPSVLIAYFTPPSESLEAVTIGIPPLEAPDTTKTVKSPDSEASDAQQT